jgi:lipopolysaccharide exporter
MNLNRQMAIGAAWMVSLRAITRALGFISVLILARLLTPADFGVVALATVIIGGLELMTGFGFDIALIQKRGHSRELYDTAWTITVLFTALTAAILLALARPAAVFYSEPRLEAVMYVLAIGTFIEGFQNIGIVAFRKEMAFGKEFLFQIAKKIVSFAVAVPLAFWLQSYWALVAGIVASKAAGTVASYLTHPYRPRWCTAGWAELFQFSRWLFLTNLLGFVRTRAADLIVGKMAGSAALGVFTVSYELATLPSNELVAPINRAVFPAYAQIAGDLAKLRQSYLDVLGLIALLAIPAAVGLAAVADLVVAIVLGPQWSQAAPLIRILGIAGAILTLETNIGSAYLALGRPDILTKLYAFYAALLVILLVICIAIWGVIGGAWACLLASLLNAPIYFGTMLSTLKMPLPQLIGVLWRPIMGGAAMYAVLTVVLGEFPMEVLGVVGREPVLLLAASIVAGGGTYLSIIFGVWHASGAPAGAEATILARASSFTRGLMKVRAPST